MNEVEWLAESIVQMKTRFITDLGINPKGVVMGPIEYLKLSNHYKSLTNDPNTPNPTHFAGMPIHIKATRGVELLMDLDSAVWYRDRQKFLQRYIQKETI